MNPVQMSPVAIPAKWVLSILNIDTDEFMEYAETAPHTDIGSILLALELSEDVDNIMSAIISLTYLINNDLDKDGMLYRSINDLPQERWELLISMRPDLMRECIRLFEYLDVQPDVTLFKHVGSFIANDSTAANILTRIWYDRKWPLSLELIFTIQTSYHGWKFMHRFNTTECNTSRAVLKRLLNIASNDTSLWVNNCALIGVNGATLEYLMHIDTLNADGIDSTIATIHEFHIWDTVMFNPAAGPIIDYIFENYSDSNDPLMARDWLIPLISSSELAGKYITLDDIKEERVDDAFFLNPHAIDTISKWIETNGITYDIVDNLVEIASQGHKEAALKAIDIIDKIKLANGKYVSNGLSNKQLALLLNSVHGNEYITRTLIQSDMSAVLNELLRQNELVPFWDYDEDNSWYIANLTPNTVSNMTPAICDQLKQFIHLLTYSDWIILLKTEFGAKLGISNIGHVIEHGAFFALLASPFVTKDQLIQLNESTDAFSYCDDEDFAALINRNDIYDFDLRTVATMNRQLCGEALTVWYNPERLVPLATIIGMDLRTYLQIYD